MQDMLYAQPEGPFHGPQLVVHALGRPIMTWSLTLLVCSVTGICVHCQQIKRDVANFSQF